MTLLLALLLMADGRTYPRVPLDKLATFRGPRVTVCGPVVYVRRQRDGDVHVTLDNGRQKVVLELIPTIPLSTPKKGQRVRAKGILRFDKYHGWYEVHPVEAWEPTTTCGHDPVSTAGKDR